MLCETCRWSGRPGFVRIARNQAATSAAQKDIAEAQLKIAFDKLKHD
jgi:hypothetical protein